MMKKFMQLPDGVMKMYFELLTDIPLAEVETILAGHPKEAKLCLASTVIEQYHPAGSGAEAAERWQKEVGGGALPDEIPTVTISSSELKDGCLPAATLLKLAGLASSGSEARRFIQGGGAYFGEDLQTMTSHDQLIRIMPGLLVKVGKKKIVRIEIGA
jgi:tyrosyl-tRNA synthetase